MVGYRVYIGGLPYGAAERDLERFFRGFGKLRDVLLKNGYGFVEFDDVRDADDAVHELNGKKLLGERVTVERARGTPRGRDQWSGRTNDHRSHERHGPPSRTSHRLIVENLSSRISWQDLKDYMRQAGEVTYADAHRQTRNEGIVEFASHSDLQNALDKLDDTELNGRRIRLVEDRKRSRRSGSGSSRSRSRSARRRSRSKSNSKSRSRSKSRSVSPARDVSDRSEHGSRKHSPNDRSKAERRSRSRSARRASKEPSADRARSPRFRSRSYSKSRSRSHSRD